MKLILALMISCILLIQGCISSDKASLKLKGKSEIVVYNLHKSDTYIEYYESKEDQEKDRNMITVPMSEVEWSKQLSDDR